MPSTGTSTVTAQLSIPLFTPAPSCFEDVWAALQPCNSDESATCTVFSLGRNDEYDANGNACLTATFGKESLPGTDCPVSYTSVDLSTLESESKITGYLTCCPRYAEIGGVFKALLLNKKSAKLHIYGDGYQLGWSLRSCIRNIGWITSMDSGCSPRIAVFAINNCIGRVRSRRKPLDCACGVYDLCGPGRHQLRPRLPVALHWWQPDDPHHRCKSDRLPRYYV